MSNASVETHLDARLSESQYPPLFSVKDDQTVGFTPNAASRLWPDKLEGNKALKHLLEEGCSRPFPYLIGLETYCFMSHPGKIPNKSIVRHFNRLRLLFPEIPLQLVPQTDFPLRGELLASSSSTPDRVHGESSAKLAVSGSSSPEVATPSAALQAPISPHLGITELEIQTSSGVHPTKEFTLPSPPLLWTEAEQSRLLSSSHHTTKPIQLSVMVSGREPVAALEGHDLKYLPDGVLVEITVRHDSNLYDGVQVVEAHVHQVLTPTGLHSPPDVFYLDGFVWTNHPTYHTDIARSKDVGYEGGPEGAATGLKANVKMSSKTGTVHSTMSQGPLPTSEVAELRNNFYVDHHELQYMIRPLPESPARHDRGSKLKSKAITGYRFSPATDMTEFSLDLVISVQLNIAILKNKRAIGCISVVKTMSFIDLLKSSGEDFTSAIDRFKVHADRKGVVAITPSAPVTTSRASIVTAYSTNQKVLGLQERLKGLQASVSKGPSPLARLKANLRSHWAVLTSDQLEDTRTTLWTTTRTLRSGDLCEALGEIHSLVCRRFITGEQVADAHVKIVGREPTG